jgi:hypothetical protein
MNHNTNKQGAIMKYLASLLTLLVLAVGCSDTSPTQEAQDQATPNVPENPVVYTNSEGTSVETSHETYADSKNAIEYPEEGTMVYTFNDIDRYNYDLMLDNPYHGLRFYSEPKFYVVGRTRGYMGGNLITPINDDFKHVWSERVLELPEPANSVTITAIWYIGDRPPIMLAYDKQGDLIDADTVETQIHYLDYLTVNAKDRMIRSIGLYGTESGTYYDNLTLQVPTNHPPLAKFDLPQTVEATGPQGVAVTLDGTLSSDPDGDALSYAWYLDGQKVWSEASGKSTLPLGPHQIKLEVSDPTGAANSVSQQLEVVDTTPPKILSTNLDTEIWPPNNKLRRVAVYEATDLVSEPLLDVTVTSDSRKFSQRDWRIEQTSDSKVSVWVRARKDGRTGRNYYIHTTASDQAGNTAETSLTVTVPHDQGH